MLFIIILCNCSVPSQLWAASVSHWVKRIARCKYKKQAGVGSCFRDFCSFSYFFPGLFRLFGWFWVLFWGFLRFQLLFLGFFPAFWLSLGAVLGISAVSATFHRFFRMLGWVLGWCQNITIRKTKHAIKIWHSLINQIH